MPSPKTVEELKAIMLEEFLSDPGINASNAEAWIETQNLSKLLQEIQEEDNASNSMSLTLSNNDSINSSPPDSNNNVMTPVFVNKKVGVPRLPNGTVNYNAMASKWKEGVKSGKINVTAKARNTPSKNIPSLQKYVASLTQKNRNMMKRNKNALLKAIRGDPAIKNKSYFMGPTPGLIPANMKKRFFEENARLSATQKAQAKQSALNALRVQKGPNINRHTSTRRKSRKNRKNRRN